MKLGQGQIWKRRDECLRIVEWARQSIGYKAMTNADSKEGSLQRVTKKEFCRLIKGAVLLTPENAPSNPARPVPGSPQKIE